MRLPTVALIASSYTPQGESGFADDELDNAAQHEAGWLGGVAELKRMHELGPNWRPLTSELPAEQEVGPGVA
ncbi:MAG: hypothetical protein GEV03_20310 [Streptosporangiales bacterium]|nr:hypothetical protein [Streptosporangiales bacterium]